MFSVECSRQARCFSIRCACWWTSSPNPARTCAVSCLLVCGNIWDVIPTPLTNSIIFQDGWNHQSGIENVKHFLIYCTVASSVLYAVLVLATALHGMSSSHSEPSKETASWSQMSDDFRWTNTFQWRSSSWASRSKQGRQLPIRSDGWVPSLDEIPVLALWNNVLQEKCTERICTLPSGKHTKAIEYSHL